LFKFLDTRTVFGSQSGSILTAFVQHSRHLPTRLQALFGQQSNCTRMIFEVHSEYYYNILNIPTVFQLHSSCMRELIHSECARIFDAGSQWIRSIRTALVWHSRPNVDRIL